MKKHFLLTSMFVMFLFTNVSAQNVSLERAKKIGELFVKESTSLGKDRAYVNAAHSHTFTSRDGMPSVYVFNIDGGGFVVVSAEEKVKPVLAYSEKGSFDADGMADGFRFTISKYQEDIDYVRKNNVEATADILEEWKLVESKGRITEAKNKSVPYLLTSTWNQNYPYNSLCPEDTAGHGGHVYAGCVATAMSQVMNYWGHPAKGFGSYSYIPTNWSYDQIYTYPEQTADFGNTYYHFENMADYVDSLSTDEEIYNIALLQWHCGISVEMMYSPKGSGAYSSDVPFAGSQFFGYNYADLLDMWYYDNDEWAEALKEELDKGRPLYYSGQDDEGRGGHAFVCDGYDENSFFHFNWGWGGRDDAYCAIGALNTTKYYFNTWNEALVDFYPKDNEKYYQCPEKINDLTIEENEDEYRASISWTNPSNNNYGDNLISIDTVFLRRDFEVIAVFTDVQPGQTMTYTDAVEEADLYNYSVYAKNDAGNSQPVYGQILLGEKCDVIFELNDEGGDGWKGGSISVFNNGKRIAIVTMEDGASETKVMPLLNGELTFVWNKCWYSEEEYYTCDEISFIIKDKDGNELYQSEGEMQPGVFMTYDNNCSLDIDEMESENEKLLIYPNPTSGKVRVDADNITEIKVMNIVGQNVATYNVNADSCEIDMSGFDTGMYFVNVKTGNEIVTKKIILTN
ncbi:MAG: thiol protease/hemagglutinin PrtT [Bacteroidales bacterium]|nr:thiol protease/hemagglutinin PrtT [Bacteroidales bacterium]